MSPWHDVVETWLQGTGVDVSAPLEGIDEIDRAIPLLEVLSQDNPLAEKYDVLVYDARGEDAARVRVYCVEFTTQGDVAIVDPGCLPVSATPFGKNTGAIEKEYFIGSENLYAATPEFVSRLEEFVERK